MPYRFKAGESVRENVVRIVAEEIDYAVEKLRKKEIENRDEAIHEARKSAKKLRGLVKLMRPELGAIYRQENAALRDVGRQLSELRDAGAIIETFDSIVQEQPGQPPKPAFLGIRTALEENKRGKEGSEDVPQLMERAASDLEAIRKRVEDWPIHSDGFRSVAAGLKESYRLGRKAMARAESKGRPELFHEWRKRAKDHWYHVRLLESSWTEAMQTRESSLHELETWLGDDHNIVVLQEILKEQPDRYGSAEDVQLFVGLAQSRQQELRENATSLGRRLYEEKPKRFAKGIHKLWDAWQQEQPEAKKQGHKEGRKSAKKHGSSARKSAA